jgi:hypothetical protein
MRVKLGEFAVDGPDVCRDIVVDLVAVGAQRADREFHFAHRTIGRRWIRVFGSQRHTAVLASVGYASGWAEERHGEAAGRRFLRGDATCVPNEDSSGAGVQASAVSGCWDGAPDIEARFLSEGPYTLWSLGIAPVL